MAYVSFKVCFGKVCITVGGGTGVFKYGLPPWATGDSEGYPGIINDLAALASVHELVDGISDQSTQEVLRGGLQSALAAVQKRGEGQGISVSEIKQSQSAKQK